MALHFAICRVAFVYGLVPYREYWISVAFSAGGGGLWRETTFK